MMNDKKKSGTRYEELVTFRPNLVLNINEEQRFIITKYSKIVQALRNKNLTVKEIHDLYRDPSIEDLSSQYVDKEHTITIKSIYRYLKILEEAGIVAEAGQRVTEGSRFNEKIYTLTAIYFQDIRPKLEWWGTDEAWEFSRDLGQILGEILKNSDFGSDISTDLILQLCKFSAEIDYFNILEVIDVTNKKNELRDLLGKVYFEDQSLITYASKLLGYLRGFKFISQLKEIEEGALQG